MSVWSISVYKHQRATNDELVKYLDRKNGRLHELETSKDSPFWARLPRSLEDKLVKRGIAAGPSDYWDLALQYFPNPVMQYVSRAKRMAGNPKIKNALLNWPRIVREHRKQRKNRT